MLHFLTVMNRVHMLSHLNFSLELVKSDSLSRSIYVLYSKLIMTL